VDFNIPAIATASDEDWEDLDLPAGHAAMLQQAARRVLGKGESMSELVPSVLDSAELGTKHYSSEATPVNPTRESEPGLSNSEAQWDSHLERVITDGEGEDLSIPSSRRIIVRPEPGPEPEPEPELDSEDSSQLPSIRFGQLEWAHDEIVQTYATAERCVERKELEEALAHHYAVVRSADIALEKFPGRGRPTNGGDGGESFTDREKATTVPDTLLDIRSKRRCSMGEAVNLLAHAERYEHVPPLCTQLLESPENEQDEIRWLFHRCVRGPQHIACYSAARRL
jgi:hypothetical protein